MKQPVDVVKEERARFEKVPTLDECVLLCNRVAKRLIAGECGPMWETANLLAKYDYQTHGVGPDGRFYGVDVVVMSDGAVYDILQGASGTGATAAPQWVHNGYTDVAMRRFPFDEPGPVDPEPPDPGGGDDEEEVSIGEVLQPILDQLLALDRKLDTVLLTVKALKSCPFRK